MVDVRIAVAILAIIGLVSWWIFRMISWKEKVLFEGILESVECENFFGEDPETIYRFSNYFFYSLRADTRLFAVATGCRIRLLAENRSGDYIPRPGDCVRVTVWYNIFGKMIRCRFKNIEELRSKFLPAYSD